MILELQEPFKSKWNKGYLRTSNDNRKRVDLFNSNNDRTTISYARYLYGIKLGYEVPSHLEVDHRDNDKTNDLIGNLQLLTQEQNRLKQEWYYAEYVQEWYGFECAWCQTNFLLVKAEVKKRIYCGGEYAFCCRSCSASYHAYNGNLYIGKK